MDAHTPGPWEVNPYFPNEVKAVYGSPGMDDSQLIPVRRLGRGRHQEANGRLIAAAPDLLDRLSVLVAAVERGEVLEHHIRSAKAVIALAEGKPEEGGKPR